MRRHVLLLLLLINIPIWAQNATLRGVIRNAVTDEPMGEISLQLKDLLIQATTEKDGSFYFEEVPSGTHTIIISGEDIMKMEFPVTIAAYQANDLGTVYVTANTRTLMDEGSLLLLEEDAVGEDVEMGDFNVSSLMISSNDVYISNVTYNFSAMRFKLRGYDNRYSDVYINGIRFNDAERGGFSYGMIGGLNDATRNKDVVNNYATSSYSFGQVGGTSNINTNATNYTPGGRASVAYTNRNYKFRATSTYSTGLLDNGWAFTGSLSYRGAKEGYVDGTFYNSLGYLLSTEKVFNNKHSISLTTFGAPTQRAQQSPNLQELTDLTGDYQYNSYWGYQDGEKRNSRVVTTYEPTAIFSHKFQINKDTRLTTNVGYKYTFYGSTALGWADAADPRPDYYRYLPSFYELQETVDTYLYAWESGRQNVQQVNWDQLYQHNLGNKKDPAKDNGSSYIVEERHNDQQMITLNSTLNTQFSDKVTFTAGIEGSTTKGMHYKTISDLLGGDFYLDIDYFARRDMQNTVGASADIVQNDMRNPNRQVGEGDRFGYNYNIYVNNANAWIQNNHRYNNWDVYYGFKVDYTSFYRDGKMQNGRAPRNSYGKGDTHSFVTQSAKLGVTYKPNGRHMFSGNVSYSVLPPLANNAYVSVRIKDDAIPDLEEEKVFAADLSYNFSTPVFRGRVSVFQTNFYDQIKRYSYYYDSGVGSGSLLNYSLSGINKMHRGVELGMEAKLNSIFTASFAGTFSEYVYTNRPMAHASYENGLKDDYQEKVYLKDYYVGGTPQVAGTLGLHAFYKYWFFDANLNGFDRNYIDLSPNRRTEQAVNFITESVEEWEDAVHGILYQEKLKGGFTLDFSVGKSIRIDRMYTLNINCQFKNVLNNKKLKTGGFEQSRYDYQDSDVSKFPSKYYYAQGFNVFLNVGLRF